jgi:hypothetical protein
MVATIIDLAQYLGMPVVTSPSLAHGEWCFDTGSSIVVAHDIWEKLNFPVFEPEFTLPNEEICLSDEHGAD